MLSKLRLKSATNEPQMRNSNKRGIRYQLLMMTLTLIVSLLLVFSIVETVIQQHYARENLEARVVTMRGNLTEQGRLLSKLLGGQVANEVAALSLSKIALLLDNAIQDSDTLTYAILTDTQGLAYIHTAHPELQQTLLTSAIDQFASAQRLPTHREFTESHVIEYITPINFAKPWGVLRLGFSTESLEDEISRSISEMQMQTQRIIMISIGISLVFITLGTLLAIMLSASISGPLIRLAKLSQRLTKVNFEEAIRDYRVDPKVSTYKEHDLLASALIGMAREVNKSQEQLKDYNRTLEENVRQRTQKLLESEKMAALGQLIAGIAHEINTPLGAIGSSASTMQKRLDNMLVAMPTIFRTFTPAQCEQFDGLLRRALGGNANFLSAKEKRQYRLALTSALSAEFADPESVADMLTDMGVYDETDDFLPLIKGDKGSRILRLAYEMSDLKKGAQTINQAMERAAKIVFALKTYVHRDIHEEKRWANVVDGIETILTLYHSQIKLGIQLIRNYEEGLPPIYCYPDDLNQVWTNLIHNALQAMEFQGKLQIAVTQEDGFIRVDVKDTGAGIPKENLERIFEPFFTTKIAGEGSGLGLHIIKNIIDKHSGRIKVSSKPGNTVFSVYLPLEIPYESTRPLKKSVKSAKMN